MEQKWSGLRAEREKIQPAPTSEKRVALKLEQEIHDLDRCLAGDATSKKWQELKVDLDTKKGELLHTRRRLAGRTPDMKSWTDPLP